MTTVALLGTLDTKGAECAFVCDRIRRSGAVPLLVDCGVFAPQDARPDIDRAEVARSGGYDLGALAAAGDRGAAVAATAEGAAAVLARLHAEGRIDAAMGVGGSGGTSIAARALRGLPLGFPKLVVSTAASGQTAPYVGESDLVLFPSVVDIAGLNAISTRILANACDAVLGMAAGAAVEYRAPGPAIAASMFGVTTECVGHARALLEERDYEVLVFHMTGAGGRTLESLVARGALHGVLDITTTELADELVGGVMSAGPGRLTGEGPLPTPRVVSLGALDMVNFGPRDTVPAAFADRTLYVHNAGVTLMRTTAEECAELGARLAARAAGLDSPAAVLLPLGGVSAISTEGGPFHDARADAALFDAVRAGLAGSDVDLVELDTPINDPLFAATAVRVLGELAERTARPGSGATDDTDGKP
ncbi:uncharacterized protein (UPF0261 family) [Murinocardiopsis flavida]|uniref:Uncharacterized protein (UPF0261 family) n=1 Tax=Murinocardiopsis flavida TaxID=645275 RepID=A0A2P8D3M9_9ACTN|nr:Tm-1-like ATP-binding domain-containing protein [Murinocardiopsis flavida]PSK91828.1 uncharacterized protein (UPF0261 family) [Murinocardiopsis flavida]